MNETYKRKSYKLFALLMLGFIALVVIWSMISSNLALSTATSMRGICLLLVICIPLLMYVIYKTERIYWFNSVTYEEAKAATSEQRKKFAMAI